uniref:Upstream stimulatory factor 2-like protein n=1 Tax=Callorhinchus milii TaxID=7868 RepID=V9L1Q9_CALMI
MMTPQDVLQTGTQRTIAPRTHPYSPKEEHDLHNMKIDGPRTPRDERRRAQHNEVERRRRDKINNWIVQLSKIIPDCNADNTKTGQVLWGGVEVKVGSSLRRVITSGNCDSPTNVCRRRLKRRKDSKWTTRSYGSRLQS